MHSSGDAGSFSILLVCTANICRSPLAAAVLAERLPSLRVHSAGSDAEPGEPMCAQSAARVGRDRAQHAAALLTAAHLDEADLVLALDRTHRAAAARLAPASRPRLFTLRQAADLADHVDRILATGVLPDGAPALPEDEPGRLRWLVGELDAARGLLPVEVTSNLDIQDNHGPADHAPTLTEVVREASRVAEILDRVRRPRQERAGR